MTCVRMALSISKTKLWRLSVTGAVLAPRAFCSQAAHLCVCAGGQEKGAGNLFSFQPCGCWSACEGNPKSRPLSPDMLAICVQQGAECCIARPHGHSLCAVKTKWTQSTEDSPPFLFRLFISLGPFSSESRPPLTCLRDLRTPRQWSRHTQSYRAPGGFVRSLGSPEWEILSASSSDDFPRFNHEAYQDN